jgi:hypothetical protein
LDGTAGEIARSLRPLVPRKCSGPPPRKAAATSFGGALRRLVELPDPIRSGSSSLTDATDK